MRSSETSERSAPPQSTLPCPDRRSGGGAARRASGDEISRQREEQSYLQPPERQTDVVHIVKGVIDAETGAIEHYNRIIEATEGVDPVTNDMTIAVLRDEEGHRRLFEGFLREYEADGLA